MSESYILHSFISLQKVLQSTLLIVASLLRYKSRQGETKKLFSDVTRYAHHVFKAFDVTGTGSISFKAGNKFTFKQNIIWKAGDLSPNTDSEY